MAIRLVVIDAKNKTYTAFEGRKKIDKVKSQTHLGFDFIEYFRTHTEEVMKDVDDAPDEA